MGKREVTIHHGLTKAGTPGRIADAMTHLRCTGLRALQQPDGDWRLTVETRYEED